ncbi:MAG: formylglycine-generating enzyme family protein [Deltaproteobacteria bacterium]|nr:formylglycine-generating enzyme family protein [Deltaproteobacteria bacterium]
MSRVQVILQSFNAGIYLVLAVVLPVILAAQSCIVNSKCYTDADCDHTNVCRSGKCIWICRKDTDCRERQYCEKATGECVDMECTVDQDCNDSKKECKDRHCVNKEGLACPDDMVSIRDQYCMDKYEASRPDATAAIKGMDSSRATSRKGVIPWFPVTLEEARAACKGAGKRLCSIDEWIVACKGKENTVYAYGNDFNPVVCNSIDTYCYCDGTACADKDPCPFPHCFNECGADFHVMPTGSFPGCVDSWGVYDINGNVWELADSNDGLEHFRGGAYNCSDSEKLHRCDHDGTWGPSARGFRCCSDGE